MVESFHYHLAGQARNVYAGMFELVVRVVHGDLDSKHCSNIILC